MKSKKTSGSVKKPRWTAAQKAQRTENTSRRGGFTRPERTSGGRDERPDRPRRFERDDRPRRFESRDDRGFEPRGERGFDRPRRFERDDRPRRYEGRDERQGGFDRPRREGGFERPRRDERGFDRPRRFERDDRQGGFERPRQADRDGRPRRFEGRDERQGGFDRAGRDERGFDRPRRFERDDRQGGFERPRHADRDDRPRRFQGHDERQGGFDRPRRFDQDDRPRRDERGFERPRHADRDDRRGGFERPRRFERDDRPRRFDREDREDRHERPLAVDPTPPQPVEVTDDNGFLALGLPRPIVERLARDGITKPFPIQAATIPDALAGRDVLGRGQTGSGKTLGFGLPLITRLAASGSAKPRLVRSIVLVPTRELAMQVSDALQPLVHVMGLRHKLVAGGMPYQPQIDALDRGLDILVATPGRLIDLVERGAADLSEVEVAVLDEADHMAEMGFLEAITEILDKVPAGGQRLLFSATLDRGIDTVVEKYLVDPVTHETDPDTASVSTMDHHILLIDPMHKKVITAEVANRTGRTVVFARTKLGADRIARQLREQGVMAAALHGDLKQGQRNRVLNAFRNGELPVLVATDVAARGIHVDDVSVVLQVDPPADHKDYLHRSGRTARAGEKGTVVTLALPHQRKLMERLVAEAGVDVEPVRMAPGDQRLYDGVGARTPSGEPVNEARYRRIVDGEPRPAKGPRRGGSMYGHKGGGRGFRGRDDRREDRRDERGVRDERRGGWHRRDDSGPRRPR